MFDLKHFGPAEDLVPLVSEAPECILPYVCMFEECKTPLAMYSTTATVWKHMWTEHGVQAWQCEMCSPEAFREDGARVGSHTVLFQGNPAFLDYWKAVHGRDWSEWGDTAINRKILTDDEWGRSFKFQLEFAMKCIPYENRGSW